jgi:hypothetical protein
LLYADGLVERRGHSITDGLNGLREFARGLAAEPIETFPDCLIERFAAAPEDDVCVLALRLGASGDGTHTL